ncbi:MAG: DNA repair protein RecN [Bacteroidetes bacterium ADurb.Bin174]|nr:MAG: DNA repair protein RecN [Bacteroidetes bacterium ADurb.Bin174]
MLKSIDITNYALISSLNIDFQNGLTVMTGETGAGKSIILGALSLILGQRADNKSIRMQEDKCIVEAVFDISTYKHLYDFFESNELDYDQSNCVVRRELTSNGKSRAFINDTPVSLNVLRDLSSQLIDIHSQHENLLLSNASYQMEVLDTVAQNAKIFQAYRDSYSTWKSNEKALEKLRKEAEKSASELDFIRFQYNQLEEAKLQADELQTLEMEFETLSNVETIKTALSRISMIFDEDRGTLTQLREAEDTLSKIDKYIPEGKEKTERIHAAYVDIKDLKMELESLQENFEFNPEKLDRISLRLNDLYALMQKFKVQTVEELIAKREEYAAELHHIESFDEDISNLEKKLAEAYEDVQLKAQMLTDSRKSQLEFVQDHMIEQLSELGMPNIQFEVSLTQLPQYSEHGKDAVDFLFSANKNRPMQPVSQIASGGEISRLMLTVKSLIANKSDLPTIIFDEIDSGVSGEIAHRMGEIMLQMSRSMQVITITHLPQIAAKGDAHFRVYKEDTKLQTETYIAKLSDSERIEEIASMLSGKERGAAAIENAKELLGWGAN